MQDRKSIFVVNSFQINLSPLQKNLSALLLLQRQNET